MASSNYGETAIGTLRWPVRLVDRLQTPDPTTGIVETDGASVTVRAHVEPVGAMAFLNGRELGTPLTHRIRIRWVNYLPMTRFIIRDIRMPDGSIRTETFRVLRTKDLDQCRRFVEIEAQLLEVE